LRVAVDGKPAFESPPLRAGGEPVPLPEIDVRGAKDLRIEVDYGEDFHVGDRVDLLEPVLIRG
ncbi:MAG: NPCBM/NEW2 domain-containing protein, partial [Planctomycetes bacterium]|nr:NPCBM/NEW2 domain-containing protein [Planctomycetota bacterium]